MTDSLTRSGLHHLSVLFSVVTGRLEEIARLHRDGALRDGSEACILAAINGQLSILEYLHHAGCDDSSVANRALPLAAAGGRLEVVRYFHRLGSDLHANDDAAIKAAAQKGELAVVAYLHRNGAAITACSSVAEQLPALQTNRKTIDYLAANGVFPDGPRLAELIDAIRRRHVHDIRTNLKSLDVARYSRLLMRPAAEVGDFEIVRLLHEHGCDLRVDDDIALRIAAEKGHLPLLQYLHRSGADIHASDADALRSAATAGHHSIVSYLIKQGADTTRVDPATLAQVRLNGHAQVLNCLAGAGLDSAEPSHRPGVTPSGESLDTDSNRAAARSQEHFSRGQIEQPLRSDTEPTVSILLANYNHAQYLPTALSGICGQTHPPTEIIVVDDGSSDDSIAIIEDFRARFPSIQLLKNGRNRGQHYSIQRALLAARGDYVVWAASDDLLLPDFLERSLRELRRNPEAGLCFSRLAVMVDGTGEMRDYTGETHDSRFDYGGSAQYLSPQRLAALLCERYLWMSGNTVVVRRSALLERGGFERSLRWHADWFAYYVVALRYGACVIPGTLALMRERRETYSGTGIADSKEQRQVLGAILDAIRAPKYADVFPAFRNHPSLLSLFGRQVFFVALRKRRDWGLAWALACWHGPRVPRWLFDKIRRWVASRPQRPHSPGDGNGAP